MKKLLASLVLGLALSTTGCGAFHAHAPVPGSANQFDSDTYLAIVTAKGVIDQAKVDLNNNSFPASIAASVKVAVNRAVLAYNVADLTYQQYHASAVAGTATPAQQAAVNSSLSDLNSTVSAVTAAKAGK